MNPDFDYFRDTLAECGWNIVSDSSASFVLLTDVQAARQGISKLENKLNIIRNRQQDFKRGLSYWFRKDYPLLLKPVQLDSVSNENMRQQLSDYGNSVLRGSNGSITIGGGPLQGFGHAESTLKLLLGIELLQSTLFTLMLEKLVDFDREVHTMRESMNGLSQDPHWFNDTNMGNSTASCGTSNRNPRNEMLGKIDSLQKLVMTTLNYVRWCEVVYDSEHLINEIITQIPLVSQSATKIELITSLPTLTNSNDNSEEELINAFLRLLNDDLSYLACILDTISNLSLSQYDPNLKKIFDRVMTLLDTCDHNDLPILVRFALDHVQDDEAKDSLPTIFDKVNHFLEDYVTCVMASAASLQQQVHGGNNSSSSMTNDESFRVRQLEKEKQEARTAQTLVVAAFRSSFQSRPVLFQAMLKLLQDDDSQILQVREREVGTNSITVQLWVLYLLSQGATGYTYRSKIQTLLGKKLSNGSLTEGQIRKSICHFQVALDNIYDSILTLAQSCASVFRLGSAGAAIQSVGRYLYLTLYDEFMSAEKRQSIVVALVGHAGSQLPKEVEFSLNILAHIAQKEFDVLCHNTRVSLMRRQLSELNNNSTSTDFRGRSVAFQEENLPSQRNIRSSIPERDSDRLIAMPKTSLKMFLPFLKTLLEDVASMSEPHARQLFVVVFQCSMEVKNENGAKDNFARTSSGSNVYHSNVNEVVLTPMGVDDVLILLRKYSTVTDMQRRRISIIGQVAMLDLIKVSISTQVPQPELKQQVNSEGMSSQSPFKRNACVFSQISPGKNKNVEYERERAILTSQLTQGSGKDEIPSGDMNVNLNENVPRYDSTGTNDIRSMVKVWRELRTNLHNDVSGFAQAFMLDELCSMLSSSFTNSSTVNSSFSSKLVFGVREPHFLSFLISELEEMLSDVISTTWGSATNSVHELMNRTVPAKVRYGTIDKEDTEKWVGTGSKGKDSSVIDREEFMSVRVLSAVVRRHSANSMEQCHVQVMCPALKLLAICHQRQYSSLSTLRALLSAPLEMPSSLAEDNLNGYSERWRMDFLLTYLHSVNYQRELLNMFVTEAFSCVRAINKTTSLSSSSSSSSLSTVDYQKRVQVSNLRCGQWVDRLNKLVDCNSLLVEKTQECPTFLDLLKGIMLVRTGVDDRQKAVEVLSMRAGTDMGNTSLLSSASKKKQPSKPKKKVRCKKKDNEKENAVNEMDDPDAEEEEQPLEEFGSVSIADIIEILNLHFRPLDAEVAVGLALMWRSLPKSIKILPFLNEDGVSVCNIDKDLAYPDGYDSAGETEDLRAPSPLNCDPNAESDDTKYLLRMKKDGRRMLLQHAVSTSEYFLGNKRASNSMTKIALGDTADSLGKNGLKEGSMAASLHTQYLLSLQQYNSLMSVGTTLGIVGHIMHRAHTTGRYRANLYSHPKVVKHNAELDFHSVDFVQNCSVVLGVSIDQDAYFQKYFAETHDMSDILPEFKGIMRLMASVLENEDMFLEIQTLMQLAVSEEDKYRLEEGADLSQVESLDMDIDAAVDIADIDDLDMATPKAQGSGNQNTLDSSSSVKKKKDDCTATTASTETPSSVSPHPKQSSSKKSAAMEAKYMSEQSKFDEWCNSHLPLFVRLMVSAYHIDLYEIIARLMPDTKSSEIGEKENVQKLSSEHNNTVSDLFATQVEPLTSPATRASSSVREMRREEPSMSISDMVAATLQENSASKTGISAHSSPLPSTSNDNNEQAPSVVEKDLVAYRQKVYQILCDHSNRDGSHHSHYYRFRVSIIESVCREVCDRQVDLLEAFFLVLSHHNEQLELIEPCLDLLSYIDGFLKGILKMERHLDIVSLLAAKKKADRGKENCKIKEGTGKRGDKQRYPNDDNCDDNEDIVDKDFEGDEEEEEDDDGDAYDEKITKVQAILKGQSSSTLSGRSRRFHPLVMEFGQKFSSLCEKLLTIHQPEDTAIANITGSRRGFLSAKETAFILTLHLKWAQDPIQQLDEMSDHVRDTDNDADVCDERYSILNRKSCVSFYNPLCKSLTEQWLSLIDRVDIYDKMHVTVALDLMHDLINVFHKLILITQQPDVEKHKVLLGAALRGGSKFVLAFLKGYDLLKEMFNEKNQLRDRTIACVVRFQKATRQLQQLCAHAKNEKDSNLSKDAPMLKKGMTQVLYRMRDLADQSSISSALIMGNLKARNLQGKVVTEEKEKERQEDDDEEEEEKEEESSGESDEDVSNGDENDDAQRGAKRHHQGLEQDFEESPPNAYRRLGLADEAVEEKGEEDGDLVSQESYAKDGDPLEDEEDYMIAEMGGFVTKECEEDSFGHLSEGNYSGYDSIDDHESRRPSHSKASKKKRRMLDEDEED